MHKHATNLGLCLPGPAILHNAAKPFVRKPFQSRLERSAALVVEKLCGS